MPLIKRLVEPVHISRAVVPQNVNNELEFVGNSALANIMRQLGTLSAHADDLFAELHRDAASLLYRVGQLTQRVERLQARIVQLNPIVEEVSLQDINMRKPFRSSIIKEQQVITKSTRPQSVMLMYQHCCEPAPDLHILNPYREDGRDSMKFYTDPDYFLELWCLEIAKDTENQMKRHKQRGRRTARPNKEPRSIRAPKSQHAHYAELRHGPEFVENLRRSRPSGRQSAVCEPRSPKADLCRTGSLQQSASEARRWNVNAGAPNERVAYQPHTIANQAHDNVHARHAGNDLNQSLPAAQPTRAASMRQADLKHQAAADGNLIPDVSIHPGGPSPPPVSSTSYLDNSGQLTSTMDIIRPGVPVSSTAQQVTVDQHKSQRDSFDLPAPPTPPSSSMVPSSLPGDQLPSPPMMVTPPPDADGRFSALPLPQYLPHPELVTSGASSDSANHLATWHNSDSSNVTPAVIDNNSDSSSLVMTQQTDDVMKNDQPLVRDTRSDLLAAIREGIQLRKVEERRQKSAQKQQQHASSGTGRLDVQAIMEAAFEMRRKALEENDSEEDDDANGRWSDND